MHGFVVLGKEVCVTSLPAKLLIELKPFPSCACVLIFPPTFSAAARVWSRRSELAHTPPTFPKRGRVQAGEAHSHPAAAQRLLLGLHEHGGGAQAAQASATRHLPHQVIGLIIQSLVDFNSRCRQFSHSELKYKRGY